MNFGPTILSRLVHEKNMHMLLERIAPLKIDHLPAPVSFLHTPARQVLTSKRIIAKKGREHLVFRSDEIAYFFTENGISYLVEKKSKQKYITAKALRSIELSLNSKDFFRVSKKYLIHIDAVVKYKPLKRGKLELVLNPDVNETITISQLKAAAFKKWIVQD